MENDSEEEGEEAEEEEENTQYIQQNDPYKTPEKKQWPYLFPVQEQRQIKKEVKPQFAFDENKFNAELNQITNNFDSEFNFGKEDLNNQQPQIFNTDGIKCKRKFQHVKTNSEINQRYSLLSKRNNQNYFNTDSRSKSPFQKNTEMNNFTSRKDIFGCGGRYCLPVEEKEPVNRIFSPETLNELLSKNKERKYINGEGMSGMKKPAGVF